MLRFESFFAAASCSCHRRTPCCRSARWIWIWIAPCLLLLLERALAASPAAQGALISPSGWTRPTTPAQAATDLTTYQRYEVFTAAAGPNTPDVANINTTGTANVYDTSGGSFITSGGNIYSFSVPTYIEAILPNYGLRTGYTTNVLLQVRTLGQAMDASSVKLISYSGNAANPYPTATAIGPASQQLLLSAPDQSGFGGTDQEWAFSFSVTGNAASYKLAFNASGSSMSLDQLSMDSQVVASYLKGDFNLDGHINAADVVAAMNALTNLTQYQQTNHLTDPQLMQIANINDDASINNVDLQSLLDYLKAGHGSATPVPEPCSTLLALLIVSGYWIFRPAMKHA